LGWIGGRPLFRVAERGFWSLNSLAIQPGYATCREGLRHLAELMLGSRIGVEGRARLRAGSAAGAGIILSVIALAFVWLAWPFSRWIGDVADLMTPLRLIVPALANAVVLLSGYLAATSLAWGLADATMAQPRDLSAFDQPTHDNEGRWRVVHLSDVHVVGERYGFRIESGRSGPRGNERLGQVLARLEAIHATRPIDLILITGDITDAGRSSEWAEFFAALNQYPELAKRTLLLPGNHDLNIVDRANPARLDLPLSPDRRLRQMRALSAMDAVQGDKVRVVDLRTGQTGGKLSDALAPHRSAIATFADTGRLRLSFGLEQLWSSAFPMVLLPESEDGLGVLLLNSNAETHFSFTNALGFVSAEQTHAVVSIVRRNPKTHWIVVLHHHLLEYPTTVKAFSERIGTALINGTWFVRELQFLGSRVVVMHGHRHIDWIGHCGAIRIASAPSPVMEATNDEPTCFYIHELAAGQDGGLCLMIPEKVELSGNAGRA
jgi:3',5'-cyclic AMP phosphodiesterase CpdA